MAKGFPWLPCALPPEQGSHRSLISRVLLCRYAIVSYLVVWFSPAAHLSAGEIPSMASACLSPLTNRTSDFSVCLPPLPQFRRDTEQSHRHTTGALWGRCSCTTSPSTSRLTTCSDGSPSCATTPIATLSSCWSATRATSSTCGVSARVCAYSAGATIWPLCARVYLRRCRRDARFSVVESDLKHLRWICLHSAGVMIWPLCACVSTERPCKGIRKSKFFFSAVATKLAPVHLKGSLESDVVSASTWTAGPGCKAPYSHGPVVCVFQPRIQVSPRGRGTGVRRTGGPAVHRDLRAGRHQRRGGLHQHPGGLFIVCLVILSMCCWPSARFVCRTCSTARALSDPLSLSSWATSLLFPLSSCGFCPAPVVLHSLQGPMLFLHYLWGILLSFALSRVWEGLRPGIAQGPELKQPPCCVHEQFSFFVPLCRRFTRLCPPRAWTRCRPPRARTPSP